jgi:hypothetical protein
MGKGLRAMSTFLRKPGIMLSIASLLAPFMLARAGTADAPKGHFSIDDQVVEDTATNLIWQRHAPDSAYTQQQATAYCRALSLDGGGWRLPTVKELHTLVDEGLANPAIDAEAFPDTPSLYFWSSTALAGFAFVWSVSFLDGTDTWAPGENMQRVRCVR